MAVAKGLKRAPVQVTLIDRSNHHLFQPLLYQVATAVLSPGQIASPLRALLRRQRNTTVLRAEVIGVDAERKTLLVETSDHATAIPYDYLVLATGVHHSYFGHNQFAAFAPGLKTLADAVAVRNKILNAFEVAEAEEDPSAHQDLLTFVLIGAGPTGVEMAGAIASLVRNTLAAEFRRVAVCSARVVLIDRADRILPVFAEDLSRSAHQRLIDLGVDVRLGHTVDAVDESGVVVNGERISSRTVIWTAGVEPSPVGRWLGAQTDRAGRVNVNGDLSVPGRREVFVIGDVASFQQDGKPLSGVAQVAIQQGKYVARLIASRLRDCATSVPFRYFDKGNMAVVGRNYAIVQSGKFKLRGWPAFFAWAVVHLQFLAQSSLRASVFLQWIWMYVTSQPGSRLIVDHQPSTQLGSAERGQQELHA